MVSTTSATKKDSRERDAFLPAISGGSGNGSGFGPRQYSGPAFAYARGKSCFSAGLLFIHGGDGDGNAAQWV